MVKVNFGKRIKAAIISIGVLATAVTSPIAMNFTSASAAENENYARLLQYSLYFYDANMCGEVEDITGMEWRSDCHLYDKEVKIFKDSAGQTLDLGVESLDLSGGYHDAGDHVKFGLPASYSFATLSWAYSEFKDSFVQTGQAEHMEIILKHFADYYEKCILLDETGKVRAYCYQVGEGNADHNYWGAPENQGANSGHSTAKFLTPGGVGKEQAAGAAMALAMYGKAIDEQKYIDLAVKMYDFMEGLQNEAAKAGENGSAGFYSPSASDIATYVYAAAGALYDVTGDDKYLAGNNATYGWAYNWSNAASLGHAMFGGENWSRVHNNIMPSGSDRTIANGKKYRYILPWGSARYNCAAQMVGLIFDKHNNSTRYGEWAKEQMGIILGDNNWGEDGEENAATGRNFVVGYADNSVKAVHHRGSDGTTVSAGSGLHDGAAPMKTNNKYNLVGALTGGPMDPADAGSSISAKPMLAHWDAKNDYISNEVAIDYQAGFVGAAAGLYALYGGGETDTSIPGVRADKIYPREAGAMTVSAVKVKEGETAAVKVTGGTAPYTYEIADEAIASVDADGIVTGNAVGETTVTVTDADGASATAKVTVDGDVPPAEGIAPMAGLEFMRSKDINYTIEHISGLDQAQIPLDGLVEVGDFITKVEIEISQPDAYTIGEVSGGYGFGTKEVFVNPDGVSGNYLWSTNAVATVIDDNKGTVTITLPLDETAIISDDPSVAHFDFGVWYTGSYEEADYLTDYTKITVYGISSNIAVDEADSTAIKVIGGKAPYTFASDDAAVAAVSADGTVSGVAEGEAEITVTDADGLKGTVAVTVNAGGGDPNELKVTPPTLEVEDELTLTVTGGEAPYTYTVGDETIATVDADGVIKGLAVGTTDITVTDSAGVSKTVTVTITDVGGDEDEWGLKGDANSDGAVNLSDLAVVLDYCIAVLVMDPDVPLEDGSAKFLNADIDEDDGVDLQDLGFILEYCIGVLVMDPDNSWESVTGRDDLVRLP